MAEKIDEPFFYLVPHVTWPAIHLEAQLLFLASIPDIFLKRGIVFEAWIEKRISVPEAGRSHQRIQTSEGRVQRGQTQLFSELGGAQVVPSDRIRGSLHQTRSALLRF